MARRLGTGEKAFSLLGSGRRVDKQRCLAAIVVLDEEGSVASSCQEERPVESVLGVIGRI